MKKAMLTDSLMYSWFIPPSKTKTETVNLKVFKMRPKNKIIKNTFR